MHPALSDIWLARFYCLLINQVSILSTYWQVSAMTGIGSTDVTFATQLDAAVGPDLRAVLGTDAQYLGTAVQRANPLPPTAAALAETNAGAGTGGSEAAVPQLAPIIQWHTALAGRKYRGRSFVSFPATALIDTATKEMNATGITKMDTLALDLLATYTFGTVGNTTTMTRILAAHAHPPTFRAAVTGHLSRAALGTQRRRSFVRHGDAIPF